MSLAEVSRTGRLANDKMANDKMALETAAVTRLLVAEGILDYSGHVFDPASPARTPSSSRPDRIRALN